MRSRSSGLSLVAVVALVVSACGGATPSPSQPAGTEAPSTTPTQAATKAPSSNLIIGVVTDVGSVNDKNFNEYSYAGAKDGAKAIGGGVPAVTVPKDDSEYATDLQAFIDQGANVIVSVGYNLGAATTQKAHDNPNTWFVGVDQGGVNICITAEGLPDPTFKCPGNANFATLLPKYVAIWYEEDQAGYLAGMAAAAASKSGEIGAIGGITFCTPCIRYIQGYVLGAQAINPQIKVDIAWVTDSDIVKAFYDPDGGKNFAKTFLAQHKPVDVLFQVAGKTGNGVLDAACEAGIWGEGVDVDQALSYPNAAKCIITSAEKKLQYSVAYDIQALASGKLVGGSDKWDASRDGIGYAPLTNTAAFPNPTDLTSKLDAAYAAMKAGTLKTCPDKCGDISTLQ